MGPSRNVDEASDVTDSFPVVTLSLDAVIPDDSDDGFGSAFCPPSSHDQDACEPDNGIASILMTGLSESGVRAGKTPDLVLKQRFQLALGNIEKPVVRSDATKLFPCFCFLNLHVDLLPPDQRKSGSVKVYPLEPNVWCPVH